MQKVLRSQLYGVCDDGEARLCREGFEQSEQKEHRIEAQNQAEALLFCADCFNRLVKSSHVTQPHSPLQGCILSLQEAELLLQV